MNTRRLHEPMASFAEEELKKVCFVLMESPFNGVVMRCNPSPDTLKAISREWVRAGGYQVLERAKPNVAPVVDDHWVTIPRSVLKQHDVSFGEAGAAKLVAMHIRLTCVVNLSQVEIAPQGELVSVCQPCDVEGAS